MVPASHDMDEDDDPVIQCLRYLDYRYIRFCYHPLLDKFSMNNSWKSPSWTSVKKLRCGVEGEDKELRSLVFGKNVIDIEEKTVMQLLIDEACCSLPALLFLDLRVIIAKFKNKLNIGIPPILCVPNCKLNSVVCGRVLLLCSVHFYYIRCEHS